VDGFIYLLEINTGALDLTPDAPILPSRCWLVQRRRDPCGPASEGL